MLKRTCIITYLYHNSIGQNCQEKIHIFLHFFEKNRIFPENAYIFLCVLQKNGQVSFPLWLMKSFLRRASLLFSKIWDLKTLAFRRFPCFALDSKLATDVIPASNEDVFIYI